MMVGLWAHHSARAALAHSPATMWSVPKDIDTILLEKSEAGETVTIFVAKSKENEKRKRKKNYKKCSSLILMNL